MARIDELITQVGDLRLQRELEVSLAEMRKQQRFGLVFEEHIPETAALFGVPAPVGSTVQLRRSTGLQQLNTYRVTDVNDGLANLEPLGEAKSQPPTSIADLLVVKRFGDPVYPTLTRLGTAERGGDRPEHIVIEGENYHALQLLLYLYEGQVDCIYADPPYNTGARDWKYNNRYVDAKDSWRHSKWLSMMERRLLLARRLLKPDGVLVVTIDEHEVHHLGMLLESVFPDADRQMVTIVINPKGVTRQGTFRFSRVEEHAIFCFLGDARVSGRGDDLLTPGISEDDPPVSVGRRPRWKGLLRSGTNARREDRIHMFYPVLIDPERGAAVGTGEPLYDAVPVLGEKINGYEAAWPVRRDRTLGNWGVGHTTLRSLIQQGFVSVGGFDPNRQTWAVSYLSEDLRTQLAAGALEVVARDEVRNVVDVVYAEEANRRLKTVWHRTRHDAGVGGSDVLRALLGSERLFEFPKSVYAVRDTLAAATRDKPEALILDFFAGSGTTLHATALLNAEDDGRRRSILVTNNEVGEGVARRLARDGTFRGDPDFERFGVFQQVTRPRCEAVVTGRPTDGRASARRAPERPRLLGWL